MDAESAREKVRKLRALAADRGATPAEAENARLAADRIEAKYPGARYCVDHDPGPDDDEGSDFMDRPNTPFEDYIEMKLYGEPDQGIDFLDGLFGTKSRVCPVCKGAGRVVHQGHGMKIDFGDCPRCKPKTKKS